MSDKIKKQIKRSMPWFLIFNLIISTAVAGLVFNFNFNITDSIAKIKDLKFSMDTPVVQADTASTTVKVRNAPPSITPPGAEEVPTSTSTSPINVGGTIGFTMTADDPEGNSYYLIICSSGSVTASTTGGPPTCGGTQFCISALTADNAESSCTYSDIDDPIPSAETEDWYAFACDNHATEGECSVADTGSGDSGSPFYVNHEPTFTAINTTVNNQDPGGTFTITASATDNDIARGAEVLRLYVCQTNNWATSTGCVTGQQLCYATSTSPDVGCSFATTTPAIHGDYTYYGFVMDDFYMPAPQNSRNNTYHVNNVAPTIANVVINGNVDIELHLKDSTDGDKIASTTSADVTDLNGCTDIQGATSTIYWSDAPGANNCAANNNNCYQIASTNCALVAGTCDGPWDSVASYICTTTMAFYALPTDNSTNNPNEPDVWLGAMAVYDEALSNATTTDFVDGVEVKTNTAVEVYESEIPYGIVQAGRNTGTSTATTTVINFGNSPLNAYVYGANMTGPGTISITEQEHSLTAFFLYGTGTNATSTLPGDLEDTVINRPTSTATTSDYIYWGINIPFGTPSGDYTGVNTFTASLDTSGVGW